MRTAIVVGVIVRPSSVVVWLSDGDGTAAPAGTQGAWHGSPRVGVAPSGWLVSAPETEEREQTLQNP